MTRAPIRRPGLSIQAWGFTPPADLHEQPRIAAESRSTPLFDGEDFTPGQQRSWVEGLVTVLGENATVRSQAAANTSNRFVESPDLLDAVTGAVLIAGDATPR